MARSRLPVDVANVTGAAARSPYRHKDRKKPKGTRALGKPYIGMTKAEIAQWHEFERDLPWLNSSHRVLLRLACRLAADMNGDEFGVSKAQALSSILSKLGATPVDESKVAGGDDEGDDEFE